MTKNEVRIAMVNLDPKGAEDLLNKNTKNRAIRDNKVSAYADTMRHGHWISHVSNIVIDSNDVLIDGQHTLKAIIKSGVEIPVILKVGIDPRARDIIDTGIPRKLEDSLKMQGYEDYSARATAVRALALYDMSPAGFLAQDRSNQMLDRSAELDFHERWEKEIESRLTDPAVLATAPLSMSRGSWVGIAVILDAGGSVDAASDFLTSLGSGAYLGPDSPIKKARDRIMTLSANDRATRRLVFHQVWRAWNDVANGKNGAKDYTRNLIKPKLPVKLDLSGPIVLP